MTSYQTSCIAVINDLEFGINIVEELSITEIESKRSVNGGVYQVVSDHVQKLCKDPQSVNSSPNFQ